MDIHVILANLAGINTQDLHVILANCLQGKTTWYICMPVKSVG